MKARDRRGMIGRATWIDWCTVGEVAGLENFATRNPLKEASCILSGSR
jgi:hypothetical protein